jgi:hypothetical protein
VLQEATNELKGRAGCEPEKSSSGRLPNQHPRADGATQVADQDEAVSPDAHGAKRTAVRLNRI